MTEVVNIRASSLGELLDCPARWKAKHIDGQRLPDSGRAHLGTAVHRAAGWFDQQRIDGDAPTADDACGAFADALAEDESVSWWDVKRRDAERVGLRLVSDYCRNIAPGFTFRAVEMQCASIDVDVGDDIVLRLTGTLDRLYVDEHEAEGQTIQRAGIADLKSGKNAVDAQGQVNVQWHGAQLAVYELLAMLGESTIEEEITAPGRIIGMRTNNDATVAIGDIPPATGILLGDDDHPGLLDYAGGIIKHGLWWGNPRSILCSERFCPAWPTCRFRFIEPQET